MPKPHVVCVSDDQKPVRIDTFLAGEFSELYSRMQIKRWIEEERVKVNGSPVKPHYKVSPGDTIRLEPVPKPADFSKAENIPFPIVFEDEDLIVIDKPAGLVVHPGVGNRQGTLVNALLYHTKELSGLSGADRPGIVHRLDKETSGLMVVAKNDWTHQRLSDQFREHTAGRTYFCVVKGVVQFDEGTFREPIGRTPTDRRKMRVDPVEGKDAITNYKVRRRFRKFTCLQVNLFTGRTHQIRVHMAYHGHPVVGDREYGVRASSISRQALHAESLAFVHPRTGKRLEFHSVLPKDLEELLNRLSEDDRR